MSPRCSAVSSYEISTGDSPTEDNQPRVGAAQELLYYRRLYTPIRGAGRTSIIRRSSTPDAGSLLNTVEAHEIGRGAIRGPGRYLGLGEPPSSAVPVVPFQPRT